MAKRSPPQTFIVNADGRRELAAVHVCTPARWRAHLQEARAGTTHRHAAALSLAGWLACWSPMLEQSSC